MQEKTDNQFPNFQLSILPMPEETVLPFNTQPNTQLTVSGTPSHGQGKPLMKPTAQPTVSVKALNSAKIFSSVLDTNGTTSGDGAGPSTTPEPSFEPLPEQNGIVNVTLEPNPTSNYPIPVHDLNTLNSLYKKLNAANIYKPNNYIINMIRAEEIGKTEGPLGGPLTEAEQALADAQAKRFANGLINGNGKPTIAEELKPGFRLSDIQVNIHDPVIERYLDLGSTLLKPMLDDAKKSGDYSNFLKMSMDFVDAQFSSQDLPDNPDSLGSFMRDGGAVCRQRAVAAKILFDKLGVPASIEGGAVSVSNTTPSGETKAQLGPHAWNEVKLGDKTYLFDPQNTSILDLPNPSTADTVAKLYSDTSIRDALKMNEALATLPETATDAEVAEALNKLPLSRPVGTTTPPVTQPGTGTDPEIPNPEDIAAVEANMSPAQEAAESTEISSTLEAAGIITPEEAKQSQSALNAAVAEDAAPSPELMKTVTQVAEAEGGPAAVAWVEANGAQIAKAARGVAAVLEKGGNVVAAGVTAYQTAKFVYYLAKGDHQNTKAAYDSIMKFGFSTGGAVAGAIAGAEGGATIGGTFFGPVGAVVGGLVGGVAGGIAGTFGADGIWHWAHSGSNPPALNPTDPSKTSGTGDTPAPVPQISFPSHISVDGQGNVLAPDGHTVIGTYNPSETPSNGSFIAKMQHDDLYLNMATGTVQTPNGDYIGTLQSNGNVLLKNGSQMDATGQVMSPDGSTPIGTYDASQSEYWKEPLIKLKYGAYLHGNDGSVRTIGKGVMLGQLQANGSTQGDTSVFPAYVFYNMGITIDPDGHITYSTGAGDFGDAILNPQFTDMFNTPVIQFPQSDILMVNNSNPATIYSPDGKTKIGTDAPFFYSGYYYALDGTLLSDFTGLPPDSGDNRFGFVKGD